MNTQVCESPASFRRAAPSPAVSPNALLQDPVGAIVHYWQNRRVRARQARVNDAMSNVSAHMLKDIGAPEWMVAQASTRYDGRALHLIDLFRS